MEFLKKIKYKKTKTRWQTFKEKITASFLKFFQNIEEEALLFYLILWGQL